MAVCKRCVGQCDDKCLMNKVAYCVFCACRGHFSINCAYYKPVKYVFAKPKKIFFDGEGGRSLVICKSEKALKAFLYFHKLSVCQKLEAKIKTMKKYCKENKLIPEGDKRIKYTLAKQFGSVEDRRIVPDEGQIMIWDGISIKDCKKDWSNLRGE